MNAKSHHKYLSRRVNRRRQVERIGDGRACLWSLRGEVDLLNREAQINDPYTDDKLGIKWHEIMSMKLSRKTGGLAPSINRQNRSNSVVNEYQ